MLFIKSTLIALVPLLLTAVDAQSVGKTTRYWDCCKPSCAWPGKLSLAAGAKPVQTCNKNNQPLSDPNTPSGCGGGSSFMCANNSPVAVNDNLAYGYAAASIAGGNEASWCCACYELTFTSTAIAGKKMIVQVTNTGGDLGSNHFDIAIPGGGLGLFDGCTSQYGTPKGGWGNQYGGTTSRAQCDNYPAALKAGCYWRYDWFKNADNPAVTFKSVACPAALTSKTGCIRR